MIELPILKNSGTGRCDCGVSRVIDAGPPPTVSAAAWIRSAQSFVLFESDG
jgi:hypothetical protein